MSFIIYLSISWGSTCSWQHECVALVDKDDVIADVIHCTNYDDQVKGPLILKEKLDKVELQYSWGASSDKYIRTN